MLLIIKLTVRACQMLPLLFKLCKICSVDSQEDH